LYVGEKNLISLFILIQICTFSLFCIEDVTFTSAVTFAMFVNSTVKFTLHRGKSLGVLRSLASILRGKSTNECQ